MLVLSRKTGEVITIGPDIRVTVVTISQGKVRLGFTAPPETKILRKEIAPTEEPTDARAMR